MFHEFWCINVYESKHGGVLPIRIVNGYLSCINSLGFFIYFLFLSDEGPRLETLYFTIRVGSTATFLYFDLHLYSAYAAHYVYKYIWLIAIQMLRIVKYWHLQFDYL